LSWESAASGAGAGTTHDLLRGSLAELPVGSGAGEVCLESGIGEPEAVDDEPPAPGAGFFYLVRGVNACGVGSWGSDSGGEKRTSAACQ
jgi:hypothetical protein